MNVAPVDDGGQPQNGSLGFPCVHLVQKIAQPRVEKEERVTWWNVSAVHTEYILMETAE